MIRDIILLSLAAMAVSANFGKNIAARESSSVDPLVWQSAKCARVSLIAILLTVLIFADNS